MFTGILHNLFFLGGITYFGKSSCDNDGELDALFGTSLNRVENEPGRDDNAGDIYFAIDFGDIFVDFIAEYFSALGVDRVDLSLIS